MKMIVVAFALVAVACAAPPVPAEQSKTLRSEFNQSPEGSYLYSFETDGGITRVENGDLKEALDEDNKLHQVVVVRGSFSYIDSEGKLVTVTYTADETGFHAEGDTIPKLPVRR